MEGNREEIIKLAKEAGMIVYEGDQDRVLFEGSVIDSLTRFFHLAQAAEREACAKVCEEMESSYWASSEDQNNFTPVDCADAIRARGQA